MTDEDVTRLRTHLVPDSPHTHWDGCVWEHPLCGLSWALDEVEFLRAENERLRRNRDAWRAAAHGE